MAIEHWQGSWRIKFRRRITGKNDLLTKTVPLITARLPSVGSWWRKKRRLRTKGKWRGWIHTEVAPTILSQTTYQRISEFCSLTLPSWPIRRGQVAASGAEAFVLRASMDVIQRLAACHWQLAKMEYGERTQPPADLVLRSRRKRLFIATSPGPLCSMQCWSFGLIHGCMGRRNLRYGSTWLVLLDCLFVNGNTGVEYFSLTETSLGHIRRSQELSLAKRASSVTFVLLIHHPLSLSYLIIHQHPDQSMEAILVLPWSIPGMYGSASLQKTDNEGSPSCLCSLLRVFSTFIWYCGSVFVKNQKRHTPSNGWFECFWGSAIELPTTPAENNSSQ